MAPHTPATVLNRLIDMRETDRQTETQRQTEKKRERDREHEKETERERERERGRGRERDITSPLFHLLPVVNTPPKRSPVVIDHFPPLCILSAGHQIVSPVISVPSTKMINNYR